MKNYQRVDPKILASVYQAAIKVSSIAEEIQKDSNVQVAVLLSAVRNLMNEKNDVCPVCNSIVPDLYNKISKEIEKLSQEKSELIELLSDRIDNLDEETINQYITIASEIKNNESFMYSYMFSGGDLNAYNSLVDAQKNIGNIEKRLHELNKVAQEKYRLVKAKENMLKHDINKYLKIPKSSIEFDDLNYLVKISFPREISSYSTGEFNLIIFLYYIYSFTSSENNTLILDDPVSSFDVVNHYKIAYEIVKNATEQKNLIVLTHSVELVNAINSQFQNKFDFYYLDEINQNVLLENIKAPILESDPNIISLRRLLSIDSDGLIDTLIKRENGSQANLDVFHYSIDEIFIDNDTNKLSNHKLCKLIDTFSSFTHTNFYKDSLNKIKYLCSLRIWVEKELYNCIKDERLRKTFLAQRSLSDKINVIFPSDGSNPCGISNFTREDIMSKKVMLNQCIHYYSQISPMAYAINLSFDQISNEINEFRDMFGKSN